MLENDDSVACNVKLKQIDSERKLHAPLYNLLIIDMCQYKIPKNSSSDPVKQRKEL